MPQQISITCSNCQQPLSAQVFTVIDAGQDPDIKGLFLARRLNTAPCPNCGTVNTISTPLLYHDPVKELLIAYVPVEVGIRQGGGEEKIVGDLMNQLTRNLPKEDFRAYMFNPKRALTLQGMMDQILEADGITKEMIAERQQLVALTQEFAQANPDDLPRMVQEHDDKITEEFFQAMTAIAQQMMIDGQAQLAQHIIAVQQQVLHLSTFGQQYIQEQEHQSEVIQEVAEEVQALGQDATRADFINLILQYQDDEERIQALVGLVRPAFDYQFFQEFSVEIGKAPAQDRAKLENIRENMVELTQAIDEQSKQMVINAGKLLQMIFSSPNPQELIEANLHLIDDTFMAVLSTNLHEAEKSQNTEAVQRLQEIYNMVVQGLQTQMEPELIFVNELLLAETEAEIQQMLQEQVSEFGDVLLEVIDAVGQVLASQGQANALEKLAYIREQTQMVLNETV